MKTLLHISILLLTIQLSAQKQIYREAAFNSQKITIELQDVDHIELVHTNEQKITISMADYAENPTNLTIKETKEHIYINSSMLASLQQATTDKFCAEQPFFASYTISIPKGSEIEIYYNNGNFTAKDFNGKLNVKLTTGSVDIQKFKGLVAIEFFSGHVNALIENTVIDVSSNQGKITHFIKFKKLQQTSTSLKGIYGNPLYKLKVQSIYGNITVSPVKTQ